MAAGNRKSPQRAKSSESKFSLMEFMQQYPDDEACLVFLWTTRHAYTDGETAYCPKCAQRRKFARYATKQQRQSWSCTACGHKVHPTAGTIFHKSSTSLHLWFYAMYLMTSTRCGISAKQLERELGVTYKTAWRMFHLIRNELMAQGYEPFDGDSVEMDESWFGGDPHAGDTARWMRQAEARGDHLWHANRQVSHLNMPERKTPVFGIVERGGPVAAYVVENVRKSSVYPYITKQVPTDTVVYTDDASIYRRMDREGYLDHRVINHSDEIYVMGETHTQTIEGFWSLVKRGLSGTHHMVSRKHLQGYLNEYVWRYNRRDDEHAMFTSLITTAALVTV